MLCKFGHAVPANSRFCPICGAPAPSEAVATPEPHTPIEQVIAAPAAAGVGASSAVAGWYSDPRGHNMMRYWDGHNWTEQLRKAEGFEKTKQPFYRNKFFIIAACVVFAFVAVRPGGGTGGGSGNGGSGKDQTQNDPTAEMKSYLRSGKNLEKVLKGTCFNLSNVYSNAVRRNNSHIDSIRNSGALTDPYAAYSFSASWLAGESFVDKLSADKNAVISKANKKNFKSDTPADIKSQFKKKAVSYCENVLRASHKSTNRAAVASAKSLDKHVSRVNTNALDKPWYPKGYSEYDDNIATKWDNSGGYDCYDCTYAKLMIVSQDGCSSSVYAEVNFLDSSGVAVDWSNDTLPSLGSMAYAELTFESYSAPSGGSVELSKIDCY